MTADAAENAGHESSAPALPGIAARGCERCGSWEAQEIGGQWLCPDCIALAGCSCAGAADRDE